VSRPYALVGAISGELLTYQGRVLIHADRAEAEAFLEGVKIIPLPPSVRPEETLRLQDHPGLAHLRWPLRKEDLS
jgi:hypothetical protein